MWSIQPLDTSVVSSWCLYFFIRSLIASSIRSFWRKSNCAASILISLSRSTSKVVLYIFLFVMFFKSSCRSIGNYKINFNKKRAASRHHDRPRIIVCVHRRCSLPPLMRFYHNRKKPQYENYNLLKFILI